MTVLNSAIVLALLLATPHDCGDISLPPPEHDRLPPLQMLPVVNVGVSMEDVDAHCRAAGVKPDSPYFGWEFAGCSTGWGVVWVSPIDARTMPEEFQCLLYHEVRGHFGGHWPANHPGAIWR